MKVRKDPLLPHTSLITGTHPSYGGGKQPVWMYSTPYSVRASLCDGRIKHPQTISRGRISTTSALLLECAYRSPSGVFVLLAIHVWFLVHRDGYSSDYLRWK